MSVIPNSEEDLLSRRISTLTQALADRVMRWHISTRDFDNRICIIVGRRDKLVQLLDLLPSTIPFNGVRTKAQEVIEQAGETLCKLDIDMCRVTGHRDIRHVMKTASVAARQKKKKKSEREKEGEKRKMKSSVKKETTTRTTTTTATSSTSPAVVNANDNKNVDDMQAGGGPIGGVINKVKEVEEEGYHEGGGINSAGERF